MTILLALTLGEVVAVLDGGILFILMIVPILVIMKIITKKQVSLFVMIFFGFCAGYLLTDYAVTNSETIYDIPEQRVCVEGEISEIDSTGNEWNIYLCNVQLVYGQDKIYLKDLLVTYEEEQQLSIGNTVFIEGNLCHFLEARNPGNFDSKAYYRSLGIYAKIKANSIDVVDEKIDDFRHMLYEFRKKLMKQLDKICAQEVSSIYKAILLGDKSTLDSDIKELYSLTGIAHVLAISGLHISFIGMFVYNLLRKRWGFFFSACISFVLVISFGIMSGMGIATVRAIVMFALKLLGEILGRIYDYVTAISLSGILLMLDNPFVIFNSGFQMSFAAIGAITLVWPMLDNILRVKCKILNSVAGGINISIMMNPIIAFNFFQLPSYSFLLNLIVVPLMSLVIISGIMGVGLSFTFSLLGQVCIMPGTIVLNGYSLLCKMVSKIPFSNVIVGKPSFWTVVVYYLIYLGFIFIANRLRKEKDKQLICIDKDIAPKGRNLEKPNPVLCKAKKFTVYFRVWICAIFFSVCMIIYFPFNQLIKSDELEISFIDVGQGDGIYIQTPNGVNITVDGGSSSVDKVGKYRIVPFLKSKAVKQIDYAVVTHTDTDHISGLIELIEESDNGIKVRNIVLPNISIKDELTIQLENLAMSKNVNVLYIARGDVMEFGNVKMECLYPVVGTSVEDKNDSSTVLSLNLGQFSMLLTGDISSETEEKILELLHTDYTVLKVAHHGSKYSSSEEFLERVSPVLSIISVGENNLYGHPNGETLERLVNVDTMVMRTDYVGAITVKVSDNGRKVRVAGHRKQK